MIEFRKAHVRDASFLVPLIEEASGGTWPAVWRASANEDESVEESGARYLVDVRNKLSVENTIVAEHEGTRIGMMCCYQENGGASGAPLSLPDDLISALTPYRQLSDPDSLFMAELCCLENSRGKGLGTRFVDRAKHDAIASGLPRVTLRVFSENTGAIRLYERCGFKVVDQRLVIAHPDIAMGGSVLLMSCALAG